MTGLEWIRESGMLTTPIALTNTNSVGAIHHALVGVSVRWRAEGRRSGPAWSLPVVAETWDGYLNDIGGQHLKEDDLIAALDAAEDGPVAEGNVGGGTGMKAFGFKARHRHRLAPGRRRGRRLHGRRAGAGQLRHPRAADDRRRAGRPRDPAVGDPGRPIPGRVAAR